jgi:hypothetical protein
MEIMSSIKKLDDSQLNKLKIKVSTLDRASINKDTVESLSKNKLNTENIEGLTSLGDK